MLQLVDEFEASFLPPLEGYVGDHTPLPAFG